MKQWLFPRLGGKNSGALLVDPSHGFAPSTEPWLKNNSQLSPAGWCAFDQPNEGCWHFLWSGDCLSIYIKIFMLIPGSRDYFQAGLAIRAAVLSQAIRWAGKSNQLRVPQSNALCCLNLDPWHWWKSPEKGVDKPNCLFQHYFARDQVQSNAQWICSLLAGVGKEKAEVSPALHYMRTSISGLGCWKVGGSLLMVVSVFSSRGMVAMTCVFTWMY